MRILQHIFILGLLCINTAIVFAENTVDPKTLTGTQLIEFYKKNPDYGKKRIGIDYDAYKNGDYVVLRGEYVDENNTPIPNIPIYFTFDGKNFTYVTSEKGIFNLEINKKNIKKTSLYWINMSIDRYTISYNVRGEKMLNDSIYHFQIKKISAKDKTYYLELKTIHNSSFQDGKNFIFEKKIKKVPSWLGIQGLSLMIFALLCVFYIAFLSFRQKWLKYNGH